MSARPTDSSDDELLRAALAGDRPALTDLFHRHGPRLRRVAYGVLLDRSEADDVVQEVFFRLSALARPPHTSVSAWLYRVTLNESLGLRRRLRRFHREWWDGRPSVDPELEVGRSRDSVRLRNGVARLAPRQRAIVTLHLDGDLEPAEIAAITGMSANAVRVTLHRAIAHLRDELEPQGDV